jgi:hypothetical protein
VWEEKLANDVVQDVSMVLWGPTHSGKTWLMRAFVRALSSNNFSNSDFIYRLTGVSTGEPPRPGAPGKSKATSEPYSEDWIFTRMINPNRIKKPDAAHILSQHTHRIELRDMPGDLASELDQDAILKYITSAKSVLVLLDPLVLDSFQSLSIKKRRQNSELSPVEASETSSNQSIPLTEKPLSLSRDQYAEQVYNLLSLFSHDTSSERSLAICVTKYDQLNIKVANAWDVIEMYFGDQMKSMLQNFRDSLGVKLKPFSISAFGYLDRAEKEPNYDPSIGELKDSDKWKPYNVVSPFFWALEQVERERLEKPVKGLLGFLIPSKNRLKAYIPYPKPIRE